MDILDNDQLIEIRKGLCIRFRNARKLQGLTLTQVGLQFGLKQSAISRYELGYTPMNLDMYIKFCMFYKISL